MQMLKLYAILSLSLLCLCCAKHSDKQELPFTRLYSHAVNDTFSIFVSLPEEYQAQPNNTYPVIYVLDANLYFDVFSVIMKKYSEVGLLSPAILVGIGYKDFPAMDSLRNRDYTYPLAIPEYEMTVSGQADKFLSFINRELVPLIDSQYRADKNNRVLMGHSLGGYFTLYALQQQLAAKDSLFSGYIAASPSTHYNHYYLLKEFEKLDRHNSNKVKVYTTTGGLEEAESNDEIIKLRTDSVLTRYFRSAAGYYKGDTYSNLDHMDTPLPTFVKGLQWISSLHQRP
jgi:predicted alpha/beta superfamily hydrolase